MAPGSAQLLAATWSWADGVVGFLLLGILLPLGVAMIAATALLGVQERDWRLVPGAVLVTLVVAAAGGFAIAVVQAPAPATDYWGALSASVGALVLAAALIAVARRAWRGRLEHRNRRELLRTPLAERLPIGALPEPAVRKHLNAVTAEHYAAEWMRYLGALDAVVTPFRRDGGVDVRSSRFVAQVKHRSDLVPVEAMRALIGVADLEHRQALFFTSGGYSRDAIATAAAGHVALFVLRPREGRLVAANARAQQLRASGLGSEAAPPAVPTSSPTSAPTRTAAASL